MQSSAMNIEGKRTSENFEIVPGFDKLDKEVIKFLNFPEGISYDESTGKMFYDKKNIIKKTNELSDSLIKLREQVSHLNIKPEIKERFIKTISLLINKSKDLSILDRYSFLYSANTLARGFVDLMLFKHNESMHIYERRISSITNYYDVSLSEYSPDLNEEWIKRFGKYDKSAYKDALNLIHKQVKANFSEFKPEDFLESLDNLLNLDKNLSIETMSNLSPLLYHSMLLHKQLNYFEEGIEKVLQSEGVLSSLRGSNPSVSLRDFNDEVLLRRNEVAESYVHKYLINSLTSLYDYTYLTSSDFLQESYKQGYNPFEVEGYLSSNVEDYFSYNPNKEDFVGIADSSLQSVSSSVRMMVSPYITFYENRAHLIANLSVNEEYKKGLSAFFERKEVRAAFKELEKAYVSGNKKEMNNAMNKLVELSVPTYLAMVQGISKINSMKKQLSFYEPKFMTKKEAKLVRDMENALSSIESQFYSKLSSNNTISKKEFISMVKRIDAISRALMMFDSLSLFQFKFNDDKLNKMRENKFSWVYNEIKDWTDASLNMSLYDKKVSEEVNPLHPDFTKQLLIVKGELSDYLHSLSLYFKNNKSNISLSKKLDLLASLFSKEILTKKNLDDIRKNIDDILKDPDFSTLLLPKSKRYVMNVLDSANKVATMLFTASIIVGGPTGPDDLVTGGVKIAASYARKLALSIFMAESLASISMHAYNISQKGFNWEDMKGIGFDIVVTAALASDIPALKSAFDRSLLLRFSRAVGVGAIAYSAVSHGAEFARKAIKDISSIGFWDTFYALNDVLIAAYMANKTIDLIKLSSAIAKGFREARGSSTSLLDNSRLALAYEGEGTIPLNKSREGYFDEGGGIYYKNKPESTPETKLDYLLSKQGAKRPLGKLLDFYFRNRVKIYYEKIGLIKSRLPSIRFLKTRKAMLNLTRLLNDSIRDSNNMVVRAFWMKFMPRIGKLGRDFYQYARDLTEAKKEMIEALKEDAGINDAYAEEIVNKYIVEGLNKGKSIDSLIESFAKDFSSSQGEYAYHELNEVKNDISESLGEPSLSRDLRRSFIIIESRIKSLEENFKSILKNAGYDEERIEKLTSIFRVHLYNYLLQSNVAKDKLNIKYKLLESFLKELRKEGVSRKSIKSLRNLIREKANEIWSLSPRFQPSYFSKTGKFILSVERELMSKENSEQLIIDFESRLFSCGCNSKSELLDQFRGNRDIYKAVKSNIKLLKESKLNIPLGRKNLRKKLKSASLKLERIDSKLLDEISSLQLTMAKKIGLNLKPKNLKSFEYRGVKYNDPHVKILTALLDSFEEFNNRAVKPEDFKMIFLKHLESIRREYPDPEDIMDVINSLKLELSTVANDPSQRLRALQLKKEIKSLESFAKFVERSTALIEKFEELLMTSKFDKLVKEDLVELRSLVEEHREVFRNFYKIHIFLNSLDAYEEGTLVMPRSKRDVHDLEFRRSKDPRTFFSSYVEETPLTTFVRETIRSIPRNKLFWFLLISNSAYPIISSIVIHSVTKKVTEQVGSSSPTRAEGESGLNELPAKTGDVEEELVSPQSIEEEDLEEKIRLTKDIISDMISLLEKEGNLSLIEKLRKIKEIPTKSIIRDIKENSGNYYLIYKNPKQALITLLSILKRQKSIEDSEYKEILNKYSIKSNGSMLKVRYTLRDWSKHYLTKNKSYYP